MKGTSKMKNATKKKKLNFMRVVLMIGYIPLLTANIILTIFASHQMEKKSGR